MAVNIWRFGFGPTFLHSFLRLVKGTAKPNIYQNGAINIIPLANHKGWSRWFATNSLSHPKHQVSRHSHTKLKNLGFSFELVRVEMLCYVLYKNMRMCHDGV
jgi:hypothetical protein